MAVACLSDHISLWGSNRSVRYVGHKYIDKSGNAKTFRLDRFTSFFNSLEHRPLDALSLVHPLVTFTSGPDCTEAEVDLQCACSCTDHECGQHPMTFSEV